ncbi:MAG: DEAD/DEAH box helicase [Reichenbachiella sp.]
MNLKKLIPELVSGLKAAGFDENPKDVQRTCISEIKSGKDLLIVAPEGMGKSSTIVISVIQKLKQEFEDVPRAIIVAATKEKAFELEAQFELLGKHTDLRTFTVFDQGIIDYQKDTIYDGVDVLIGTPKRLNELLKMTGVHLSEIKMFVIDDAELITIDKYQMIYRLAENVNKSQFLIVANSWNKNFTKLTEGLMISPKIIKSE